MAKSRLDRLAAGAEESQRRARNMEKYLRSRAELEMKYATELGVRRKKVDIEPTRTTTNLTLAGSEAVPSASAAGTGGQARPCRRWFTGEHLVQRTGRRCHVRHKPCTCPCRNHAHLRLPLAILHAPKMMH